MLRYALRLLLMLSKLMYITNLTAKYSTEEQNWSGGAGQGLVELGAFRQLSQDW